MPPVHEESTDHPDAVPPAVRRDDSSRPRGRVGPAIATLPNAGIAPMAASPTAVKLRVRRTRLRWTATVTTAMAVSWLTPLAPPYAVGRPAEEGPVAAEQAAVPSGASMGRAPWVKLVTKWDELAKAGTAVGPVEDRAAGPAEEVDAASRRATGDAAEVETPVVPDPVPIAELEGVEIVEPTGDAYLVGFHEAYYGTALPVVPADPPTSSHGRRAVEVLERGHERDAPLLILPTRNRTTHPASAMDIAVPVDAAVAAPISGTVTRVVPYDLYGRHPDNRIEIRPEGRDDLLIVILHVQDPRVEVGDRVVAGETPIAAGPTALPFESQIDRFTEAAVGAPSPHVHLEMKRVG